MTTGTPTRLLEGKVLRGCNVHYRSTVFAQRVDLGDLAGLPTSDLGPEFASRFLDRFERLPTPAGDARPHLHVLGDRVDGAGVPIELALLEAVVTVELATSSTMRRLDTLPFTKIARDPSSPRMVELVWECHSGSLSRAAARAGLAGMLELIPARRPGHVRGAKRKFEELYENLQRRARRRQWSPTTAALAATLTERGLPFEPMAGAYLRVGEGVMQRVVSSAAPEFAGRPTTDASLDEMFPSEGSACVPAALIVGERGTNSLARHLDGLLRASGSAVGLATRKLTTVAGRPVDRTAIGRRGGARFLLGDPRVERLVYAISPRSVVERGLRVDRANVTAILDPVAGGDPETYRRGIDVAVSATTDTVVLTAENPHAERLARELGPRRVVLVARRASDPVVRRHLAAGGRAVVRAKAEASDAVQLRRAKDIVSTVPVSSLRATRVRVSERHIVSAMFATALAHGLGLAGDDIVAAFEKRRYLRR